MKAGCFILILVAQLVWTATVSCAPETTKDTMEQRRSNLVAQLKRENITDIRVLSVMETVPRHLFVPATWREFAYLNRPLPIGLEQTISQPYIVAYMTEALELRETDRVLEIGTGSGYHAAVMAELCKHVYTIEILPALAQSASRLLDSLGYRNITVRAGDGYIGWAEYAPYSAIILTAAPPEDIPQPLLDQLAVGGRLIAPVGTDWQELVLVTRTDDGYSRRTLIPVRFVPMTGRAQDK